MKVWPLNPAPLAPPPVVIQPSPFVQVTVKLGVINLVGSEPCELQLNLMNDGTVRWLDLESQS